MKRTLRPAQALLVLLIVAGGAPAALADWQDDWTHFWRYMHIVYARNNAWPDPFNEIDAYQVVKPFEIMKANGWRMHNTIGHELFRNGDAALKPSGHRRVHWIATQAPTARRAVFVLRGASQQETDARVVSVQEALANIHGDKPIPPVFVTATEPATSSGAWATKINREWLENLASPQLPSTSASGQQSIATPSGGSTQ